MLNLNDLQLFVRAVDSGGFTAAARTIGAPKSTISKRVAELEVELGARLIHRTSRTFTLTEVGREFYEHARASLIEAEAVEEVVRRRLAESGSRLRSRLRSSNLPTGSRHSRGNIPGYIWTFTSPIVSSISSTKASTSRSGATWRPCPTPG